MTLRDPFSGYPGALLPSCKARVASDSACPYNSSGQRCCPIFVQPALDRTLENSVFSPVLQVALLTVYDMCKAVDRGMIITDVRVLQKHGGKSGSFIAG